MRQVIKAIFKIAFKYFTKFIVVDNVKYSFYGVMDSSFRPKPITSGFKIDLHLRFQCHANNFLINPINNSRNSQRAQFTVFLTNIMSIRRFRNMFRYVPSFEFVYQFSTLFISFDDFSINSGCPFTFINLCNSFNCY